MTGPTPFKYADAIHVLESIGAAPPREGTYDHARWMRDLLLVAWVSHHPERIADLFRLTWKPDNSGHLRRDADARWQYKNISSNIPGSRSAYVLAPRVAVFVDPYIGGARAVLVKPGSDSMLNMPSNHIQTRIETLLTRHFGRAVSFSELRMLDPMS